MLKSKAIGAYFVYLINGYYESMAHSRQVSQLLSALHYATCSNSVKTSLSKRRQRRGPNQTQLNSTQPKLSCLSLSLSLSFSESALPFTMSNLLPKPPEDPPEYPFGTSDPSTSLRNLSAVRTRMESLHMFLSESVNANTLITAHQMDMVSSEISSAIHQIILNGAALIASSHAQPPPPPQPQAQLQTPPERSVARECEAESDYEVVEIDAVELLAEHIHFCEICGKGFKRDANLRMHMRAHGNEFKTPEALAKPDKGKEEVEETRKRRFSCPYQGCNRNKNHRKFRALKSVICVKNHFKRSHCPKMYTCDRCHKKSFSVLSDLRSHHKHCGESRWKCSCGTTFSRKDKLFGHLALFEGHMPQPEVELELHEEEEEEDEDRVQDKTNGNALVEDAALFQGLLDDFEFGSIENYCLQDVLGSAWNANGASSL